VSRLLHAGSIAAVIAGALAVSAAPAATPPLPTLNLSAPKTVKINHPYRIRAYGETKPDKREGLYVFIRTGGKCRTTPLGEAQDGSYSAFGPTITYVGPGKYSKKTPQTIFGKRHKHAKICGYLVHAQQLDRRAVRKIESVAD
jgi:hypothetical protein